MIAPHPYVGLQPFKEEDYPYFFGRERDIRVISSNLLAQSLTVLYGPSGVGKSSVLRAGVLPHLKANADGAVVYFKEWQSESFLDDLTYKCRTALQVQQPDAGLETAAAMSGRRLFVLLDQFEELLQYHEDDEVGARFDAMLARLVNRQDLAINFLIGIREDALSRFDQRFSIRIADLLGNTLPLGHLSHDAGRRAILGPLDVFNERHRVGQDPYRISSELVNEVLRQVQVRRFAETEAVGRLDVAAPGEGHLEAPFLQLVLRRLWDEEQSNNSQYIRLETLQRIGGARQIVDQHVNRVLCDLPVDGDREIAARIFTYLVTPSRSKVSQSTADLIDYAEAPELRVRQVLGWLSDKPESRILRRLDSPERYEIFHDVLAQPILDWRKKFFLEKAALENVNRQKENAARARREVLRLRWMLGAMALLMLVAGGLAWYALVQRMRAQEAATQLIQATNAAQAERDRAREAEALAQAKAAGEAGAISLANELKETAETARLQALESDRRVTEARRALAEAQQMPVECIVPDIRARTVNEISALVARSRLVLGAVRRQVSERPDDTVLSQSPGPGTSVRCGTPIDIQVAEAGPPCSVPNLVGANLSGASSLLARSRLALGAVRRQASEGPSDTVLGQSPGPGTSVRCGTQVDIQVADVPTCLVPNLVGTPLGGAGSLLARSRLALGAVRRQVTERPRDTVLDQSPSPGTRVPCGTRINIVAADATPAPS
jgi:hypothetical protein